MIMKILIDNGHGSDTPGKRSPDGIFREYKWCREIAEAIVRDLVSKGYDAERIVTEDNDISLRERVARVNAWCNKLGKNNVILVSIHVNAAANSGWQKARGWSAYTSVGNTKSDHLAEYLYQQAKQSFSGMKIRTDRQDGDSDWEENFYILKNTLCPAVLTENFFQDNQEDVSYLISLAGRNAVVSCHTSGLINYINSVK